MPVKLRLWSTTARFKHHKQRANNEYITLFFALTDAASAVHIFCFSRLNVLSCCVLHCQNRAFFMEIDSVWCCTLNLITICIWDTVCLFWGKCPYFLKPGVPETKKLSRAASFESQWHLNMELFAYMQMTLTAFQAVLHYNKGLNSCWYTGVRFKFIF